MRWRARRRGDHLSHPRRRRDLVDVERRSTRAADRRRNGPQPTSLEAAVAAGAKFGLAPGFDAEIVDAAHKLGLPFAPGVMTPSELGAAVRHGVRLAKYFPAGAAGGPRALEAISAPFTHLGMRFVPTGGVSLDNMSDWLKLKAVAAVGGTWIARPEDIRERRFTDIARNAQAAVKRASEIRSSMR
jgi:2-dehydro-3-deoxyphosphogluconate aldolase/(4S)-4-hydroxy-2-oxoglutarate aldolase